MTRSSSLRYAACAALVAVLVGACADTHGLKPVSTGPRAAADLHSEAVTDAARVRSGPWPSLAWWKPYANPGLDELMDDALKASPSLAVAEARLRKVQTAADLADAALSPSYSLGGSATYERLSKNFQVPPPYGGIWAWLNDARLNVSYEVDLWGKNAALLAAAVGEAQAARVDVAAARLVLTTAIAQTYVQLAMAYDLRDVAREDLDDRQKMLDLTIQRVAAGLDSDVERKQAEAAVPVVREAIADADEAIRLAQDQLAALAGAGPDRGLRIARPDIPVLSLTTPPELPSHLPADLIGRRPDIVASRLRVEAAAQDVNAARAAFYPNVDLNAFAGFQSIGLSRFISSGSAIAGIGPAVNLPIFNGATLRSGLGARAADYDAAVAAYDQTLITALKDIADTLNSLRAVAEKSTAQQQARATAQEAYDLALLRYREGLGTYLQVLSAHDQVLTQRRLAADLRARHTILMVALTGAIGGGFTPEQAAAIPSAPMPESR